MASYTANQLAGSGTPCELLDFLKIYTFTISNPLSGSVYFTFETPRDKNGFYLDVETMAKGDFNNLSNVSTLIQSPYIFSVVVSPGGGSFNFTVRNRNNANGAFLRATGGATLQISQ